MYKSIKKINDFLNYSYKTLDDELRSGFIIYIDSKGTFKVINTVDFSAIYEEKLGLNFGISFVNDTVFLIKDEKELLRLNQDSRTLERYYECSEEAGYSSSVAILKRGIILDRKAKYVDFSLVENYLRLIEPLSGNVIFSWNHLSGLTLMDKDLLFFESHSGGEFIQQSLNKEKSDYVLKLDNGSFGKRLIGYTDEVLYLQRAVSKPDHINILSVNKNDGTIIWEQENTFPYYNHDDKSNKLYGLGGSKFEMIDCVTGNREIEKELNLNVNISSHLTYYSEGRLYFTALIDNKTPVLGAINVQTGQLEFTQEVEISGEKSFRKGLDKPIVVGKRLYVKDSMNTLHIFEKEAYPASPARADL